MASRPPTSRSSALAPADYPAPAIAAALSGGLVVGVRLLAPEIPPLVPLGAGALVAAVVVRALHWAPAALGVCLAGTGLVAPEPFRTYCLLTAPVYLAVGTAAPLRREAGLGSFAGAILTAGLGWLAQFAVAIAGPGMAVGAPLAVVAVWTPVALPFLLAAAPTRPGALALGAVGVATPLAAVVVPTIAGPSATSGLASSAGNAAPEAASVAFVSAVAFLGLAVLFGSPLALVGRRWRGATDAEADADADVDGERPA
jgi:hypothetical protein